MNQLLHNAGAEDPGVAFREFTECFFDAKFQQALS